jgi:hypothetical protein
MEPLFGLPTRDKHIDAPLNTLLVSVRQSVVRVPSVVRKKDFKGYAAENKLLKIVPGFYLLSNER